MISPLTPKSSSTPSSRRAFCSSASVDTAGVGSGLRGSASSASGGSSKPSASSSEGCASRRGACRAAARARAARRAAAPCVRWTGRRAGMLAVPCAVDSWRELVFVLVVLGASGAARRAERARGGRRSRARARSSVVVRRPSSGSASAGGPPRCWRRRAHQGIALGAPARHAAAEARAGCQQAVDDGADGDDAEPGSPSRSSSSRSSSLAGRLSRGSLFASAWSKPKPPKPRKGRGSRQPRGASVATSRIGPGRPVTRWNSEKRSRRRRRQARSAAASARSCGRRRDGGRGEAPRPEREPQPCAHARAVRREGARPPGPAERAARWTATPDDLHQDVGNDRRPGGPSRFRTGPSWHG